MKLIIGIAIYITDPLHLDFTEQTLKSLNTKYNKEILLISNYVKPELQNDVEELAKKYDTKLINNPGGNSVSGAWNIAIQRAFVDGDNPKYVLLPNNDIVFKSDCIDNLINFAEGHNEAILWTANTHENLRTLEQADINDTFDEHPHFSCFMMSVEGLTKLRDIEIGKKEPHPGLFDTAFKAGYFEDNDMHNRILRAKLKAYKTASAVFYHYGSRTIKVDDDLFLQNKVTYEDNRQYFIKKWGFDPHSTAIENDDPIRFKFPEPFYGA